MMQMYLILYDIDGQIIGSRWNIQPLQYRRRTLPVDGQDTHRIIPVDQPGRLVRDKGYSLM